MLVGVPAELIPGIWGIIEPFLARSLAKTQEFRFGTEDLLELLMLKRAQLWVAGKPLSFVAMTEIIPHPKAVELSIGPVAGEMPDDWAIDLQMLEDWGRSHGCTHVCTLGRMGWQRKLGWQGKLAYCTKELGRPES